MPRHSCCEVRVMQLHDILLLRTSASLHSVSVGAKPLSTGQCAPCRRLYQLGGLTPTTDTSLFLTTYSGSHLPADIIIVANNATIINDKSSNPAFWQILTDQESASFLDCLFSRDRICGRGTSPLLSLVISVLSPLKPLFSGTKKSPSPEL